MSEYRRPSQGQFRGGVPTFFSGEEVDRILAPKIKDPRRSFSLSPVLSDLGNALWHPINRTLMASLVLTGSLYALTYKP